MLRAQRMILISFNCILVGAQIMSCSYYKTQINTNRQKPQCLKLAWAVCFWLNSRVQSRGETATRWSSLLLRPCNSWFKATTPAQGSSAGCALWATQESFGPLDTLWVSYPKKYLWITRTHGEFEGKQAAVALNFSWQSTVPPGRKPETGRQGPSCCCVGRSLFGRVCHLTLQLLCE